MKPAKVRLLESAFAGYTGVMSGVMFKDGVSLSEILFIDQQRICSVMKAETIDGKNVSGAAALSESRNVSAKDAVAAEKAAAPVVTMERESDSVEVRYTRAELEALADKDGIAALRNVGNEHGVREKSIEAMIEGILNVAGGE